MTTFKPDQRCIDLFDDFTHGTMSRRDFMERLANHAFNNDTNEVRYDKEAADLVWGRTVGLLKEHLAG